MTLTDKWKKGELKRSWYYVLTDTSEEYVTFIDGNWIVDDRLVSYEVKEVLAPVPSYEEWQELKDEVEIYHNNFKLMKAELEREIENQQLKELLKECRDFFYENLIDTEFYFSYGLGSDIKKQSCIRSLSKLKTKIDNVMGEKK